MSDPPPWRTSMEETASGSIRLQYTHPPNGSFNGTPSYKTRARLAPLAPMPRNETPCEVGLAMRLPLRRKSEKPATFLSVSSSVGWGDARSDSLSRDVTDSALSLTD